MDRPYKYEPLGDATRKFRVLELKPWGVRVPVAPFTFRPPNLAPEMPGFRDNSRHALQTDDPRIGLPRPNAARAPLEGKLLMQDVERFTKYEALSWCWGDKKEKYQSISLLNANGQRTYLTIGGTLHNVLKTLRYKDRSRFLWIDKICINQTDHVEREQQLKLIAKIYQTAEHVCVYLGPEENDSDIVPHFLQHNFNSLFDTPANHRQAADRVRRWNAFAALMRRKWFTRRWVVQEIAFAKKATLYFGRHLIGWDQFVRAVWLTIQREDDVVRLLTEHRRGRVNAARWDDINIRAYGAQSLLEVLGHLVKKLPNGELERLATIGTLVSALVAYDVTQSRDAIYAILRLGRDTFNGNLKLLKPDYKDEPVDPDKPARPDNWLYTTYTFEVYGKFVRYVISESASLDIICVPWAPELNKYDRDKKNMPSWIGSRKKRPFKQLAGDGMYKRVNADCLIGKLDGSVYCATGLEQLLFCQPKLDSKPRSLIVDGFQISGIAELGDICEKGNIPFEWLHMAWEHDEAVGPTREVGEDEDIESAWGLETLPHPSLAWQARDGRGRDSHGLPYISDAFWRTLVGDRDPEGRPAPAWYRKLCKTHFRGRFGNHRGRRGKVFTDEVKQLAVMRGKKDDREFIDRLQAVTWNRRFMFTYDGRMGIVPGEARRNDRICLLWGCNVPVVLRPLTRTIVENFYHRKSMGKEARNGVDVYKLIGACYVHGIMDGELVKDYPELRKPHR